MLKFNHFECPAVCECYTVAPLNLGFAVCAQNVQYQGEPMTILPFYIVTLSHPTWDEAVACARELPEEALPELRLDHFLENDPEFMIRSLQRRCVVSCRRSADGGTWQDSEEERIGRLLHAWESQPAWLDLEWDLDVPFAFRERVSRTRLLRSVHVTEGCFDLEERLWNLPAGDAFKWVGVASHLSDNARLKPALAWARQHGILLSAFFRGPKGIPSRCMQAAWGGSFTYVAPDDANAAAPGQLPLSIMRSWRCHKLHHDFRMCGVMGSPVMHSKGPAFHNARFQRNFKDLIYLPLECDHAQEAYEALDALDLLGVSLTSPLKQELPRYLGLQGPLNTLWRRSANDPWQSDNTDFTALDVLSKSLEKGPVLILGDGGAAQSSRVVFESRGWPVLMESRRHPLDGDTLRAFKPVGVIQATRCGMSPQDPLPFPDVLDAVSESLRWAVEWIYAENTDFSQWARESGLTLIDGSPLFEIQAEAQSKHFIEGCG
jgi:3-dehydroquinate dehydratase type I